MTTWSDWEPVAGFELEETIYQKKYRDRGGGVGRILFNRPQRLNDFTGTGMAEFVRAVRDANSDPEIGVIVVSGLGDHFGTGGDVQWEAEGGLRGQVPDFDGALRNCLKPTIAAVKGYCIGGHHHLAYHCDFTIAADTAIFGQNGPRVGSPAHGRSVAQLAHIIGVKRAKEFWMLCRQYTAQQTYEMGLANAVVPIERLDEEVDQWCDELLDLAPTCLAIVKQSFEAVGGYLAHESGRILSMIAPDFHSRPEVREAQQAWLERRPPNFWPVHQAKGSER
jgi:naphthoate synthase/2-ketocyclohexanecarboxyl-CoA hydrolase